MEVRGNLALTENHLSDHTPKWFAIYTKFRAEKEVARRLTKRGIECYVPVNQVVRQYSRKRKVIDLPLINCYAFVKITRNQYVPVLETEYVIKFIHFSKNLIAIPDSEIQLLKRICLEIDEIETEEIAFKKGKPVEIISGNLTGIQGKLVSDLGKNFLVELQYIGIGLRVEIDPKLLKPLPGWKHSKDEEDHPVEAMGRKYWG
ncbi:MAG: UpxY family transcription antiterminator [Saprospiraceae bacterium]|nr:UpxY family transcription antiterminator [Saprospiraceae bacterium]